MANKGTYNGTPPKYLNDFSKALASEVRILLNEVGQLRDERRKLQYEIAELMAVKSKHGAGGEYTPDWQPKLEEAPAPAPPPPAPPAIENAPAEPAKTAWRTVNVRQERRQKAKARALPPPTAPEPAPAPPLHAVPPWTQWKPNSIMSPAPHMATAASPLPTSPPPPPRGGLFGPPSPPPK